MRSIILFLMVFLVGSAIAQNAISPSGGASDENRKGEKQGLKSAQVTSPTVHEVVRGWEIDDVSGVALPLITRLNPDYSQGKRAGNKSANLTSKKGAFLVVQLKCSWGTRDPLRELLFTGRPDVVLVDAQGNQYPVQTTLSRQAGSYLAYGMRSTHPPRPWKLYAPKVIRVLICFDVPAGPNSYSLQFANGGPTLPVNLGGILPDANLDIPE